MPEGKRKELRVLWPSSSGAAKVGRQADSRSIGGQERLETHLDDDWPPSALELEDEKGSLLTVG